MTSNVPLDELGEFLKRRRAELSPRTVGLPETTAPRRVAGLRREEVAQLASISTDYYTRLEQGRMQASAPVLDTLARVLHPDDDQRAYLFQLAGKTANRAGHRGRQKVQLTSSSPGGGANTGSPPARWAPRRSITRSSANSSWTGTPSPPAPTRTST